MAAIAVSSQLELHTKNTLVHSSIELVQDYLPRIREIVKRSLLDVIPLAACKFMLNMNPINKIKNITTFALSVLSMCGILIIDTDKSWMKRAGAFKIDDFNSNAELRRKVIEEFSKLNPSIDFDQSIQMLKIEQEKIEKKFHLKNVDVYISFDKNNGFALKRAICIPLRALPLKKEQNDCFNGWLSHELAHIKHKHVLKRALFSSILKTFSLAATIFLSSYLWLGLPLLEHALSLWFIRKQEFEAELTAAESMGTKEFIQARKQQFLDYGQTSRKKYNPHHNPSFMQRVVSYISPGSLWYKYDEHGNFRKDTHHPRTSDVIKAVENQK